MRYIIHVRPHILKACKDHHNFLQSYLFLSTQNGSDKVYDSPIKTETVGPVTRDIGSRDPDRHHDTASSEGYPYPETGEPLTQYLFQANLELTRFIFC